VAGVGRGAIGFSGVQAVTLSQADRNLCKRILQSWCDSSCAFVASQLKALEENALERNRAQFAGCNWEAAVASI